MKLQLCKMNKFRDLNYNMTIVNNTVLTTENFTKAQI